MREAISITKCYDRDGNEQRAVTFRYYYPWIKDIRYEDTQYFSSLLQIND